MTTITNDAWLILVYKDFDTILVSDYKEADKVDTSNIVDTALKTSASKTSLWTKVKNAVTGDPVRLISAGLSSSIAQSMISKSGLPSALVGRIQSSVYDIIADGKVSNTEVANDFIGSCVNELDSVAIGMGFPTPDALYSAIKPNGAGVNSGDFVNKFEVIAKEIEADKLKQKNKVAQDLTVIKFMLCTDDSETWASELPSRKTQNGFDIIDAIENSNKTKDFTVSIMNNEAKGVDIYAVKNAMEGIRDGKIPFDIYVNDPFQKKQLAWKYCFFTNVAWTFEGTNTLNCTMGITKIPQYTVESKPVGPAGIPSSNRGGSKATSTKGKSDKTTIKKKDPGAYPIKKDVIGDVNNVISGCNTGKYHSQAEANKLFKMYTGYDATHFGVSYNKTGQNGFYYSQSTNTVRR